MRSCIPLLCLAYGTALYADEGNQSRQKIYSHLLVGDFQGAVEEGASALERHPESFPLCESYLIALGRAGKEKEMWEVWEKAHERFGEAAYSRYLLEEISWGILQKGAKAPSPLARTFALVGAFTASDARSVEVLQQGLRDPHQGVRLAAIELASRFLDEPLKQQILHLVEKETSWEVRLSAIRAAGRMKIGSIRPWLEKILSDENTMAEEKALCAEALVNLMEDMGQEELEKLARSDRAGLRYLACQVALHCKRSDPFPVLQQLLDDPHPEIRASALQACGVLSEGCEEGMRSRLEKYLLDPHPEVALSAAWFLMRVDPKKGSDAFRLWLRKEKREERLLAASALGASGNAGVLLGLEWMESHEDPYVRLNLAWGLLPNLSDKSRAIDLLTKALREQSERWTTHSCGIFHYLLPMIGTPGISLSSPEEKNWMTRLEILNTLAMLGRPSALEAFRHFLQEKKWSLSPLSALVLLTEGDEDAISCVQELLGSSDAKLRLHAALILALWGREEEPLQLLKKEYPHADRPMKEKMIEAIGKVGGGSAIPFLVERLREPFPTLRLLAAASLLECLNH